jgi:hypothetical protein
LPSTTHRKQRDKALFADTKHRIGRLKSFSPKSQTASPPQEEFWCKRGLSAPKHPSLVALCREKTCSDTGDSHSF